MSLNDRDEEMEQYERRIYDHVFGYNIEVDDSTQHNGNSIDGGATDGLSVSAMTSLSLKNPQDDIGNLSFDKDGQLAVEFVCAAANIRAATFGIPLHNHFEAKGIAGNIIPLLRQ
ncbi:hypothetical protein K2173_002461 [Erythroxylum novogranatense]|uniref:Ubiquitin-activating enzyme SCCH domain-containing protein n=1 Tax=Erythroxylum novogranatense TaxID=1862640 RepID=A0AAV8TBT0_9ROSI|nr:hypothetical protein K2173_002461 [Erythroxylum novogranatense]